jgi:hypothetical protein
MAPPSVARSSVARSSVARSSVAPPSVAASTAPPRTPDTADWQGWWDPAVASAMPAFNPTPASVSGAGPAIGDPPTNGYGNGSAFHPTTTGLDPAANGHGTTGHGITDGAGTNGHDTSNGYGSSDDYGTSNDYDTSNGYGTNGYGANDHGAAHGYGANGHATAPPPSAGPDGGDPAANRYGSAPNGRSPAADGADPVGSGAEPVDARFSGLSPTDTGPIRIVLSDAEDNAEDNAEDGAAAPRGESTGGKSYDAFFVSSLWGADGTPNESAKRDGAGLEPGTSTPTYRVATGPPMSPMSLSPSTSTSAEDARRPESLPPRPSPSPRPLVVDAPPLPTANVPEQRPSGPVDPVSGLRRRVPQSHISAQLRTPEPEAAPLLHRPSTADAAAALSRYQASRAAAQARVGGALPTDPATTTTTTDGVHE